MLTIWIVSQTFTCRVGVVPQLDCGVLIRRDCPILTQLLRRTPCPPIPSLNKGLKAKPVRVELPVRRDYLTRVTEDDPSLHFARAATWDHPPPTTEKTPSLTLKRGVLYRWVEGKSQVVVPAALCLWVLSVNALSALEPTENT